MNPFGASRIVWRVVALAAVPLLVVFLPKAFNDYFNYRLAFVGIYFIAIVGLNILTGYNGQISLGHGAFMAVGAYTTAILNVNYGVGLYWTIPLAGIVTGLFGFAFGFPALRLSGVYLALATFGLAVSIPLVAKRFEHFTGGGQGKTVALPSSPIGGLSTNQWVSYLTWAIAGLMFGLAWWILRGNLGRAFRAVRDAPIAAVSSGVSLARYKTLAFGIAAAYAGVAGALLDDRDRVRQPGHVPRLPLDPAAHRRRRRRAQLARGHALRRGLHPVRAGLGGSPLQPPALQRGDDPVDRVLRADPAARCCSSCRPGSPGLMHQLAGALKRLRQWFYSRAHSRATA